MIHHPTVQDQLFEPPVERVHVHLAWGHNDGWTVHVSHRHAGQQTEEPCLPASFDRLCYAEAIDVTTASVWELLPHLANDPRW